MGDKPKIHYVDIETFGLDAERHAIWEIAVHEGNATTSFFFEATAAEISVAEAAALRLTHYYERAEQEQSDNMQRFNSMPGNPKGRHSFISVRNRPEVAEWLAKELTGWLAGNAVHFDELRLANFIRFHGWVPIWNHHLLDVETYAAGVLGLQPPWKASELSEKLGVPQPQGKHAAGVDAQWSKELYEAASALHLHSIVHTLEVDNE